jgi:predicted ArsR family transcriptional regulator
MLSAQLESVTENELQKKIVDLLESKGPMTRADLVHQLQVARTTIYDMLVKLMNRNVVDKHPVSTNKRGRPKVLFQIKEGVVAN